MAMDSKDLSVLAYSNGFTLWHYKTIDSFDDVEKNNYFKKVANILNTGDIIVISNGQGDEKTSGLFLILNVMSGTVMVKNMAIKG